MNRLLEGKTAYITGGSRGIGKAIALLFAQQGANIIFTATKETENTQQLLQEIEALGVKARFFAYNAADIEACKEAINQTITEFGRIDILVNNAGITKDNLLMRMSENDWDIVLNTNTKSVFNHVKMAQSAMLKQRAGSIINISSIVGMAGNAGQANYAASKAAIIGFTQSVAKELGSRNIRCNAIAPGFIETDMTQKLSAEIRETMLKSISLKRMGNPEDVAKTALFLASDLAGYVSGQVIRCDGGM